MSDAFTTKAGLNSEHPNVSSHRPFRLNVGRHTTKVICGALASLLALLPVSSRAEVVLFDTLPPATTQFAQPSTSSSTQLFTQLFTTGNGTYSLDSITLNLRRSAGTGDATVQVRSGTASQPGATILETLTLSGSYSASLAPTAFSSAGLALASGENYWVVLSGVTGSTFEWSNTQTAGTFGPGYQRTKGFSFNEGASWSMFTDRSFQMKVAAVPEPAEGIALVVGLLVLAIIIRRRRMTPGEAA